MFWMRGKQASNTRLLPSRATERRSEGEQILAPARALPRRPPPWRPPRPARWCAAAPGRTAAPGPPPAAGTSWPAAAGLACHCVMPCVKRQGSHKFWAIANALACGSFGGACPHDRLPANALHQATVMAVVMRHRKVTRSRSAPHRPSPPPRPGASRHGTAAAARRGRARAQTPAGS